MGARKRAGAADGEGASADAADIRTHRNQHMGEVGDFRLAGSVGDGGGAAGEGGGHQAVFGGADGDFLEMDVTADEAALRCFGQHVAILEGNRRAEGLHGFEVQINRAGADGAAAGQRHLRAAFAGEDGAEHEDRSAHGAHEVVRCGDVVDGFAGQRQLAGVVAGCTGIKQRAGGGIAQAERRAVLHQQLGHRRDIGEVRYVIERDFLAREERRAHQRQGGILRAADRDIAIKRAAAGNEQFVHRFGGIAAGLRV